MRYRLVDEFSDSFFTGGWVAKTVVEGTDGAVVLFRERGVDESESCCGVLV